MSVCPHPRTRRDGKQNTHHAWIPASAGMTELAQQFVVMPVKACPVPRYGTGIQGLWVHRFMRTRAQAPCVKGSVDPCFRRGGLDSIKPFTHRPFLRKQESRGGGECSCQSKVSHFGSKYRGCASLLETPELCKGPATSQRCTSYTLSIESSLGGP